MAETTPHIDLFLARFADLEIERQYRQHALPGQRKRAVVITVAMIAFPSLNLLHEIPQFLSGESAMSLIFLVRLASVSVALPVLIVLLRARLQSLMENVLSVYGMHVVGINYLIMAYHPGDPAIVPVTAVGATAFVYFFSPLQLPRVILLGIAVSITGWIACAVVRDLPQETAFRLALWLLALNTVGYVGANILHQTLRELFWDRRLLAEQKKEAEAAYERERAAFGQFKQFAELISHEFRNPLAVVKSQAQLLQLIAKMGAPANIDALPAIERAVSRLDNLFNQWLAHDRLADGDIVVNAKLVMVADIFRLAQIEAPSSAMHPITFDAAPGDLQIMADPALILTILANLIDNAVKYSPKGGAVAVRARREGRLVAISVEDHGCGIDPAQAERVFDKYFRVSHDNGVRGFGLGLHLVRHIVEMLRGTVTLHSTPGRGTTVLIHLPMDYG